MVEWKGECSFEKQMSGWIGQLSGLVNARNVASSHLVFGSTEIVLVHIRRFKGFVFSIERVQTIHE
jgi:hypothetical protein